MTAPAVNELQRPLHWRLPTIIACVIVAAAFPFLWSRNFGLFIIGYFFFAPGLACAYLAALIVAIFSRSIRNTLLATMALSLVGLALLLVASLYQHDRLNFLFWYPFHLKTAAKFHYRDAMIMPWDSWGMAGMENDSYLISNPARTVTDIAAATRWLKAKNYQCDAAGIQHMIGGFYILTTYNCPL